MSTPNDDLSASSWSKTYKKRLLISGAVLLVLMAGIAVPTIMIQASNDRAAEEEASARADAWLVKRGQEMAVSVSEAIGRDALALAAFDAREPSQMDLDLALEDALSSQDENPISLVMDPVDTLDDDTPTVAVLEFGNERFEGILVELTFDGNTVSAKPLS